MQNMDFIMEPLSNSKCIELNKKYDILKYLKRFNWKFVDEFVKKQKLGRPKIDEIFFF